MNSVVIADFESSLESGSGLSISVSGEALSAMTRRSAIIEDRDYLVSLYISCATYNVPFDLMPHSILIGFAGQYTGDETSINSMPYNDNGYKSVYSVARPFISNVKLNGISGFVRDTANDSIVNAIERGGMFKFRVMAVLQPL